MKIGLWNIDHAEYNRSATRRYQRYQDILTYLNQRNCDVFIITEANAAIQMEGYHASFSAESPFLKKDRCYKQPNSYHQVGIYSKFPLMHVKITEPVNGLLSETITNAPPLFIYGNVITIKDQWKKDSQKTYSERLGEQLKIFSRLVKSKCIIGGDFNLRLGWPQKRSAHQRVKEFVNHHGLVWPTEKRTDTVQHVIHSSDLTAKVFIDLSVQHTKGKNDKLSDHPFLLVDLQDV